METRKMKLALSAGALALSLALAGCGGGGSSGTPSGPTQAELDAANQQAAEEKAAKEKAEMEKAAEEAARKEAEEKLAEKEAAERKAAAAASLKDAKALFTAAGTDGSWDHEEGSTLVFKPKYGGTTTVSITPDTVTTSFNRKVAGEALGKGGTMLDKVGMWSGTMVSAADTATAAVPSDTVVIYTNIGKDATKAFHVVHGDDPVTAEELTEAPKMVTGSDFGTGNVAKNHAKGAKVSGTFDGASGTYSCGANANDCTSQAGDGGGIKLAGMWTFTANAGATVMVPDANYSYFGWWLEKDAGSPDTFKVHAFQNGTSAAVSVSNTLSGTAKYMGPAVGKYAMVHDDGDGPSHTGGHFTAMADLMADFGDRGGVAMSKVTGSIKDFVGGSDTMDTWEVKLDSSANGGDGSAVWHIGDNKGTSTGSFTRVFREAGADLDPQTLTGTWQTRFDPEEDTVTGHMIGAFGATKQ